MFKHIRINGESRIVFEYGKQVHQIPHMPFLIAAVLDGGIR